MATIIAPGQQGGDTLVDGRVKLLFAILSALGGMVLASNAETETFALVAIFFAVFGYLFVDWLALFALPSAIAYVAMIGAAVYCVSDFVVLDPESRFYIALDLHRTGDRHLVAVSELLVLVQSILMLQQKTRRVCEQLCVFCLLELIVAAVFNNALSFGIMMIPIGLVAAYALALLSGVPLSQGMTGGAERASAASAEPTARSAPQAGGQAALQYGMLRSLLVLLIPAVLMIAGTFFYAIPRTTEAARMAKAGNALVGFSEMVRLQQFGQMQQSAEIALRVWMTERATGKPYQAINGIYLRGRVLEHYHSHNDSGETTADWSSLPGGMISDYQRLPSEHIPARKSDRNFYDAVRVDIDCKPMRSDSLFSISPYYRTDHLSEVVHQIDRWTLRRRDRSEWEYPALRYSFGTHAFRDGYQSEWISRFAAGEIAMASDHIRHHPDRPARHLAAGRLRSSDGFRGGYRRELLRFDEQRMPTVKLMADALASSLPEQDDGPVAIAYRFVEFLKVTGGFQYTLNLNAEPSQEVDPIEKFVATDRRGHCQYFASALAMMLRSQGIPARLVVGYHTDDFNELGQYYVARQSHAHAWVEALIDEAHVDQMVYGQPKSKQYWLRLDPTPGGTNTEQNSQGVNSVIDLAETLWKGYVVDMNTNKASAKANEPRTAMAPIVESRDLLTRWLELIIDQIRAGKLGGGTLSLRNGFSWPAALFGVLLTLGLFGSLRALAAIRWRTPTPRCPRPSRPSLRFYAEALDALQRLGIQRQAWQTPDEFAAMADAELARFAAATPQERGEEAESPIRSLTAAYYRLRFGKITASSPPKLHAAAKLEVADRDATAANAASPNLDPANLDPTYVDPQWIATTLAALQQQVQARLARPPRGRNGEDSTPTRHRTPRENAL
ncbi:MAG: DUF3488 and DUF4129 domain-containing transglutaminase family protein [Novipirellula sp. JB048]